MDDKEREEREYGLLMQDIIDKVNIIEKRIEEALHMYRQYLRARSEHTGNDRYKEYEELEPSWYN